MIDTQLVSIKTYKCPRCGCLDVIEESVKTSGGTIMCHVNGHKWERRKFLCGQVIEYCPPFKQEEVSDYYVCTNDVEYIKRKNVEQRELASLHAYIDTLDLSPAMRKYFKTLMR